MDLNYNANIQNQYLHRSENSIFGNRIIELVSEYISSNDLFLCGTLLSYVIRKLKILDENELSLYRDVTPSLVYQYFVNGKNIHTNLKFDKIFQVLGWPSEMPFAELFPGDILIKVIPGINSNGLISFVLSSETLRKSEFPRSQFSTQNDDKCGKYARVLDTRHNKNNVNYSLVFDCSGYVPSELLILRIIKSKRKMKCFFESFNSSHQLENKMNNTFKLTFNSTGSEGESLFDEQDLSCQIDTVLPANGLGYYRYEKQERQFAINSTILSIIKISHEWHKQYPDGPRIGIGDISKKCGLSMSPHKSHRKGIDVDVRPMRIDNAELPTSWNDRSYSRELTLNLINYIKSNSDVQTIFFNDPVIVKQKLSNHLSGHDNHLHVRFNQPPNEDSNLKEDPSQKDDIQTDNLKEFGGPEQTKFKRLVYDTQRNNAKKQGIKFVPSIPTGQLDFVNRSSNVCMIKEAATKCKELLEAAKMDLSQEKLKDSNNKIEFWAQSGYRDVERELELWEDNFPDYYNRTVKMRQTQEGGEHGIRAAEELAKYIAHYKAIPGYGKHSRGQAIDFQTRENGIEYSLRTTNANVEAWKKTWFYQWLLKNAHRFQFAPNPRINEPWHWEYHPISEKESYSFKLFEDSPSGETLYEHIDLHIGYALAKNNKNYYTKPCTGIYIPSYFIPKNEINLIVYLHGYKYGLPSEQSAINEYWNADDLPFFAFREGLERSGKNAVLVAPTLGPKSQAGDLPQSGSDAYLEKVIEALHKKGYSGEIGELVLSCHSGGGFPMAQIAAQKSKFKIVECWGFDCLYRRDTFIPSQAWLDWASKNKDKNLYVYHHSKDLESEYSKLRKGAINRNSQNIHIQFSNVKPTKMRIFKSDKKLGRIEEIKEHFLIPMAHWEECIARLNWD